AARGLALALGERLALLAGESFRHFVEPLLEQRRGLQEDLASLGERCAGPAREGLRGRLRGPYGIFGPGGGKDGDDLVRPCRVAVLLSGPARGGPPFAGDQVQAFGFHRGPSLLQVRRRWFKFRCRKRNRLPVPERV